MTVSPAEDAAMSRAFALALHGPRGVNPQVGAVLLSPDGAVVAEGWHRGAGTPHAEVDALSKLPGGDASGLTAVVTLEPCNHRGRTGPCSEALIAAGIARVVYALDDPTPAAGGGAERLAQAGVEVEGGVRADEAERLLDSWLVATRLGRPRVTVKWAQSLDGRAAAADGTSQWITGPRARADVHRRRAAADAIVAGIGTVLADDPALTARREDGSLAEHQPRPVILGQRRVPDDALVRRHPLPLLQRDGDDLAGLLDDLRAEGVQHVFVEGGPTIASAFLRAGLADEVLTYIAPTLLGSGVGGADHPALRTLGVETISQQRRLEVVAVERLGDDLLVVSRPATSEGAAS
jgi:diaminohydroxyphosphoribosylaminopyrimidine deaminase / 5-amino-6-(5-phosphoribosylamino)uracil reductase